MELKKTWTWLRKGNLKRETESLLTVAQKTQLIPIILKRKLICNRITSDNDDHIKSKCRKLAQKEYKTRHEWVGKVICWELRKKLKFDYTIKLYKHKAESDLEK